MSLHPNKANVLSYYCNTHLQRLKGGTTAVVCLIRDKLLLTAWLGDSQAVLVRDGIATQLVNPHKPDRPVSVIISFPLERFSYVILIFFVITGRKGKNHEFGR